MKKQERKRAVHMGFIDLGRHTIGLIEKLCASIENVWKTIGLIEKLCASIENV